VREEEMNGDTSVFCGQEDVRVSSNGGWLFKGNHQFSTSV